MNTLRSIVVGAALLTLPAEAQDHRFEAICDRGTRDLRAVFCARRFRSTRL
jgi:hypothetical protein